MGIINSIRNTLYFSAKVLGDANAVQNGKVGKRIISRVAGKIAGRILGRLLK